MKSTIEAKAACLCGSINLKVMQMSKMVGACHCSICRKWSGSPMLAVDCHDQVTFDGEENITVYNSSEWAERGFCSKCGTHLFYRLKQPLKYVMPAGLFDEDFEFDHQIFVEEKPEYYKFANETHDMTGEEVFAMFNEGCES